MTMAMETILKKIFTDHLFKPLIVNLLSNVLTFWKLRGTLFPKLTSSSISAVENFHLMAIILSNICKIESLSDEPRVCDPRVTFYDVLVQFVKLLLSANSPRTKSLWGPNVIMINRLRYFCTVFVWRKNTHMYAVQINPIKLI